MGRRRSVAETIERRFPYARKRPGAWSLPVLAPGRIRAPRTWPRVQMSFLRRAPREVYRVYGEDQYLEGEVAPDGASGTREDVTSAESDGQAEASWSALAADIPPVSAGSVGSASAHSRGPHAARLVGVGLLLGVCLATLALVVANLSHRQGAVPGPLKQEALRDQGVDRASEVDRGRTIAGNENAKPTPPPRNRSFSPALGARRLGARRALEFAHGQKHLSTPALHRALGEGQGSAPRPERSFSATLRASTDTTPAHVAAQPAPQVASAEPVPQVAPGPPAQDEFGFEW